MWPKNIAPWAQSIAQIGPVAARLVANFRFEIPTKKFTWSVFLRGIFPLQSALAGEKHVPVNFWGRDLVWDTF